MKNQLVESLEAAHRNFRRWTSPDRTEALLLAEGARILGLFAPGSERNFFWTHPSLDATDTALAFYQSAEWPNPGGDRTWLASEADLFFPHFPELGDYRVPHELDPGDYQWSGTADRPVMANRLSVQHARSGATLNLVIEKTIEPAPNPLRQLEPALAQSLAYAGYTSSTRLAFAGGAASSIQVGLWDLLQLPHGGDLFIPTYSRPATEIYTGKIDSADLIPAEHLIRYRMRAAGKQKLGILPPATTGRIAYLYAGEEDVSLVIKNFFVDPSGEYIDVPWNNPERPGSAIQACNIHCDLGHYAELEYHTPAIGGISGRSGCEDRSQVWAFRGQAQQILRAVRILVSAEA